MKKLNSKTELFVFIFITTFFICLLSPISPFYFKLIGGTDSFVFRYGALAMREGLVPYRDFFDHKGLMIYVINYLGLMIHEVYGVWIVEFVFMFFSIYFTYKLLDMFEISKKSKYFTVILVFSLLGLTLERGNFVEEYALLPTIVSLYIFVKYYIEEKISGIAIIINGACFAIVCLLRINMIALWIVNIIYIFAKLLIEKEIKSLIRYIICFLGGIAIVVVPSFIYLVYNNAFLVFLDCYLGFNFKYSGVTLSDKFAMFQVFFNIASIFVSVIASLLLIIRNEKNYKSILTINLIATILNLVLLSLSGREYMHYGMTAIPFLILPYGLLMCHFKEEVRQFVCVILLAVVLIPNVFFATEHICKIIDFDNTDKLFKVEVVKENTSVDDRISVYGNENYIYFLSGRLSASYYSYQSPIAYIDNNIFEEYLDEIKDNKPKIVVVIKKNDNSKILISTLEEMGYEEIEKDIYKLN